MEIVVVFYTQQYSTEIVYIHACNAKQIAVLEFQVCQLTPAPLCPSRAVICPSFMTRFSLFTAVFFPNFFVRFFISIPALRFPSFGWIFGLDLEGAMGALISKKESDSFLSVPVQYHFCVFRDIKDIHRIRYKFATYLLRSKDIARTNLEKVRFGQRNSKLSRPDRFDIKSPKEIENPIDNHHKESIDHGEIVIWRRSFVKCGPLKSISSAFKHADDLTGEGYGSVVEDAEDYLDIEGKKVIPRLDKGKGNVEEDPESSSSCCSWISWNRFRTHA